MKSVNTHKKKLSFKQAYRIFILLVWTVIELLPFYWILVLPWKTWDEALLSPFAFPTTFTLDNFAELFDKFDMLEGIWNSFLYSITISVGACFLGCLCAYGLTRMRKKSAPFFDKYLKLGLVMPTMCLVSTTFLILRKIKLVGTFWAVVLPTVAILQCSTTLCFSVWFMKCPTEYEEAAIVDGCGPFRLFAQIVLPQVLPGLLIQCTTIFIMIWNNYEAFKVYALGKAPQPVTMMVAKLFTVSKTQDWGLIGAGILVSSLPSIIVYCIFNRFLQKAYTGSDSLK